VEGAAEEEGAALDEALSPDTLALALALAYAATDCLPPGCSPEMAMALLRLGLRLGLPRLAALAEGALIGLINPESACGLLQFADEAAAGAGGGAGDGFLAEGHGEGAGAAAESAGGAGGGEAAALEEDGAELEPEDGWHAARRQRWRATPGRGAAVALRQGPGSALYAAALAWLLRNYRNLPPDFEELSPDLKAAVHGAWRAGKHIYRAD
jgi:hypothetical protein